MNYKNKFATVVIAIEQLQLQGELPKKSKEDVTFFLEERHKEYSEHLANNIAQTRKLLLLWQQEYQSAADIASAAIDTVGEELNYPPEQVDAFIEKASAMADILYIEESAKLRPIVVKQVQHLVRNKRIIELIEYCNGDLESYPLKESLHFLKELFRFAMDFLIDRCESKYGKGGLTSPQAQQYRDRLLYRVQIVTITAARVIKHKLNTSYRFTPEDYNKCRDLIESIIGVYDVVGKDSSEIAKLLI